MRLVPPVCLNSTLLLLLAGAVPHLYADEAASLRLIGPATKPVATLADEAVETSGQPPVATSAGKAFDIGDSLSYVTADQAEASKVEDGDQPDEQAPPKTEPAAAAESEETADTAKPKSTELPQLTPELLNLRNRMRQTLAVYYPKHLVVPQRSCWEVMHGIIAYGVEAKLFRSANRGQTVNAIGWMCYNQPCHGESLFYLNHGKLAARLGPGLQGHTGQFLAIIAQSHVPTTFPLKIGGKNFTVQDLIEYEKSDCRAGEELTFKLISMSHYLNTDDAWTTRDGQNWSVSRLIQEELKQPILRVAACGGTHRLMGHSYALYKRRKEGLPIDGQFARAEKFIADYHKYTFSLQNADGSFSTRWFEGREAKPDIDRRLKTSGHIFEWMAFSVPEGQLDDPRMIRAAGYLTTLLAKNPNREWEIGPLGHALHSLRIYDRRLSQAYDTSADPKRVMEPTTANRQSNEAADVKVAQRPKAEVSKDEPQSPSEISSQPDEPTAPHALAPAVPPIELAPAHR